MTSEALMQAVMNIPCDVTHATNQSPYFTYKLGHKAAITAAREIIAEHAAAAVEAEQRKESK
jgi:hypothetical protein